VLFRLVLPSLLCAALPLAAPAARARECSPLKLLTSLDLKVVGGQRPGVEVQVAGTPRLFLIDTGGVTSTLSREAADELQLPVRPSHGYVIKRVNGQNLDRTVRVPTLGVGAVEKTDRLLFIGREDANPKPGAPGHFDGSLAPDFLLDYDADLDFAGLKLNLFSPDHCPGMVVYWWAPAVAVVPFELDKSGHATFDVVLDGRKVSAMLDTGSTNTNLNLTTARRAFNVDTNAPAVERIGRLKGNYSADIYRRHFKSLTIGNVTLANPVLVLLPDMISDQRPVTKLGSLFHRETGLPSVVLGMSVLGKLHIYIAYRDRRLYISANPLLGPVPAP
jgi:hypothetical protein